MRIRLIISLLTLISIHSLGQSDGPKEITPPVLQQIKTAVDKLIPAYKKTLERKELSSDEIAFSIDTFYIQQVLSKRIDLDYTTAGMNKAVQEMSSAYDQLLNKYYNRLLKLLKPQDKTTLVAAQKAWLQFRDTESKLIKTLSKDEYSGGGTIQSNIVTSSYADLVVKRCIDIFNYYDDIIKGN
jgi:uncharacterized protein YecT (DUF1311 family)